MTHKLAQALSTLLHPLLMPTLLSALLLYFSPSVFGVAEISMQWRLLFLIFTTTFLIPLLSIVLMFRVRSYVHDAEKIQANQADNMVNKESNMVTNLEMKEKNDRLMPFLTTTVFYMVTTYLFLRQMNSYYTLVVVLGGITFSIALVTLISLFWKISAHSVGINGVAGFLFGFYQKYGDPLLFYPILFVILIAGLVMSARLLLNTHNPSQVFAGAALGWLVGFGTVYLLI